MAGTHAVGTAGPGVPADGRCVHGGVAGVFAAPGLGGTGAEVAQILRSQPLDFVQLTYNLVDREVEQLHRNGIRVRFIGDLGPCANPALYMRRLWDIMARRMSI